MDGVPERSPIRRLLLDGKHEVMGGSGEIGIPANAPQASKDDHELASELFQNLPTWLESGTIKPSVPKLLDGLESVPVGFQEYRDGKISGYKIVYKLDDGR
jgi:hypothetical protein